MDMGDLVEIYRGAESATDYIRMARSCIADSTADAFLKEANAEVELIKERLRTELPGIALCAR